MIKALLKKKGQFVLWGNEKVKRMFVTSASAVCAWNLGLF